MLQYKCPDCGKNMIFDSDTGTLGCESCSHKEQIEGYQKEQEPLQNQFHTAVFGDEEARQYQCKKCGAILVTDNHSAADTCCFCGSPMTSGGRISGDYAPSKVIPFSVSKKEAVKAFQKWRRKLKFSPKDFSKDKHIRKVTGIYLPFWLHDLRCQGEAELECTKSQIKGSGEDAVTETSHFDLYRQVDLSLNSIPVYASDKIPDKILDALGPFDYSGAKAFQPSALTGFVSEKYSYTDKEMLSQITKRAEEYMDEYISSTIEGYDSVNYKDRKYHITQTAIDYVLLPVWFVYYDYNDEEYIFAMNGQTGKLAAIPPRSISKIAVSTGLLMVLFFCIFRIITVLLGGPLL